MNSPQQRSLRQRLRRLRPLDLAHAAVIALLMVVIETSLALGRLPWIVRRLGLRLGEGSKGRSDTPDAPAWHVDGEERRWILNAQRVLKRWPLDRSCLRRSLLLGWILRAHAPVIVIGVRPDCDGFAAHAWVRVDGVDLDPEADTYAQF